MKLTEAKDKLKQHFKELWIVRLVKTTFRHIKPLRKDKSLCLGCAKEPIDRENSKTLCFTCYINSIRKLKEK